MIRNIDLDNCNACGICVEVCPVDILRIEETNSKPIIAYPDDCMTCYNCEIECPCHCIYVDPLRKPIPFMISPK